MAVKSQATGSVQSGAAEKKKTVIRHFDDDS